MIIFLFIIKHRINCRVNRSNRLIINNFIIILSNFVYNSDSMNNRSHNERGWVWYTKKKNIIPSILVYDLFLKLIIIYFNSLY